jgi:hypothetical protein
MGLVSARWGLKVHDGARKGTMRLARVSAKMWLVTVRWGFLVHDGARKGTMGLDCVGKKLARLFTQLVTSSSRSFSFATYNSILGTSQIDHYFKLYWV